MKRYIYGKINIYFCCNDCSFSKFTTIDKEEISDYLIRFNLIRK